MTGRSSIGKWLITGPPAYPFRTAITRSVICPSITTLNLPHLAKAFSTSCRAFRLPSERSGARPHPAELLPALAERSARCRVVVAFSCFLPQWDESKERSKKERAGRRQAEPEPT